MARTLLGTPLWASYLARQQAATTDCEPVRRLAGTEWYLSPYNLYLKALEIELFRRFQVVRPALEIGGGGGETSQHAFAGRLIDVDCEYYVPNLGLNLRRGILYAVTRAHVGGSPYAMPFRSGAFNTVVSIHVFDHLTAVNTALAEIARVLRPGGLLAFTTYAGHLFDGLPVRTLYRRPFWSGYGSLRHDDPDDARGQNMCSLSEWRAYGQLAGLNLIEVRSFTRRDRFLTAMRLEMAGDPRLFRAWYQRVVSQWINEDLTRPPPYADAGNVLLVWQRTAR